MQTFLSNSKLEPFLYPLVTITSLTLLLFTESIRMSKPFLFIEFLKIVIRGGYAMLLFKINKLDTEQSMTLKVKLIKEKIPVVETHTRLRIPYNKILNLNNQWQYNDMLGDFWVTEMRYWKGVGGSDSESEIQGIGDAWACGNSVSAHFHMKVWFDKIQVIYIFFLKKEIIRQPSYGICRCGSWAQLIFLIPYFRKRSFTTNNFITHIFPTFRLRVGHCIGES